LFTISECVLKKKIQISKEKERLSKKVTHSVL